MRQQQANPPLLAVVHTSRLGSASIRAARRCENGIQGFERALLSSLGASILALSLEPGNGFESGFESSSLTRKRPRASVAPHDSDHLRWEACIHAFAYLAEGKHAVE